MALPTPGFLFRVQIQARNSNSVTDEFSLLQSSGETTIDDVDEITSFILEDIYK